MNKKWLDLVKLLGPMVLSTVSPKLAPVADKITSAIESAEALHGASGKDKLAHVQAITNDVVDVLNAAKGHTVVSKEDLHATVDAGVSTVVEVVNLVHKKSV